MGTIRGCRAGAVGQAWEPRGGRQAQRRPPTRHCLDAAIIVSSEHPGSACAAEKELTKKEGGRRKPAKPLRACLPACCPPARPRLFLCLGSPLCAPQALLRGTDPRGSEKPGGDGAGVATLGPWPTKRSEFGFSQRMVGSLGPFCLRGL